MTETRPTREMHPGISSESKQIAKTADAAANDRGPNPFPGRNVQDMTISELQVMERWLGIRPCTEERRRREQIRRQQLQDRR